MKKLSDFLEKCEAKHWRILLIITTIITFWNEINLWYQDYIIHEVFMDHVKYKSYLIGFFILAVGYLIYAIWRGLKNKQQLRKKTGFVVCIIFSSYLLYRLNSSWEFWSVNGIDRLYYFDVLVFPFLYFVVVNLYASLNQSKKDAPLASFIERYTNRENTDYAALVYGKWGHGKTFALNKIAKDSGWIMISLFGKETVEEVKEEIAIKSLLKNRSKSGLNILNNFPLQLNLGGFGLSNEKSKSFLLNSLKMPPKIMFDDLERTKVDMELLKGYISNLLEGGSKVLIVGNLDKVEVKGEEEKEGELVVNPIDSFIKNKEKIIGAEFHFEATFESLNDLLAKRKYFKDEAQQEKIKSFFERVNFQNLRLWRRAIIRTYEVLDKIKHLHIEEGKAEEIIQDNDFCFAVLKDVVVFHEYFKTESINKDTLWGEHNFSSDVGYALNRFELTKRGNALNFNFINKVIGFYDLKYHDLQLDKKEFYQNYYRERNPIYKLENPLLCDEIEWNSTVTSILNKVANAKLDFEEFFKLIIKLSRSEVEVHAFFPIINMKKYFEENKEEKWVDYSYMINRYEKEFEIDIRPLPENEYAKLIVEMYHHNLKARQLYVLKNVQLRLEEIKTDSKLLDRMHPSEYIVLFGLKEFVEEFVLLKPKEQMEWLDILKFNWKNNLDQYKKEIEGFEANRIFLEKKADNMNYPDNARINKLITVYNEFLKHI
jgi:hypothetical protein